MRSADDYSDILDLPHYQSVTRQHMSAHDRAAQFAPFAALKGYEEEIEEAARFTESRTEPDDAAFSELNEKLLLLKCKENPFVEVIYFREDLKKEGGTYLTLSGEVKRVDETERMLLFRTGEKIPFSAICEILLR